MFVLPIVLCFAADVAVAEQQAAAFVALSESEDDVEGPPPPPAVDAPDAGPDADEVAAERQREQDRKDAEDSAARAKKAEAEAAQKAAAAQAAILVEVYAAAGQLRVQQGTAADARLRMQQATDAAREAHEAGRDRAHDLKVAANTAQSLDKLFDQAVEGQVTSWDAMDKAYRDAGTYGDETLAAVRRSVRDAEVALDDVQSTGSTDGLTDALADLGEAQAEVSREIARFEEERDRVFFAVAEAAAEAAQAYHAARLALLPKVSRAKYDHLHELGDLDAQQNLRAAFRQIWPGLKWHMWMRARQLIALPHRLVSEGLFVTSLLFALMRALVGIAVGVWLYRRVPAAFKALRSRWVAAAKTAVGARQRETLAQAAEAVGPFVLLASAAWFVSDSLSRVGPRIEIGVFLEVALYIWGYRAAAKLLHLVVVKLARRHHQLEMTTKLKALRSVRLLMRYTFVAAYVLGLVRGLVGSGVVTANVQRALVVGFAGCCLLVAYRWRNEIHQEYKRQQPAGRLAETMDKRGTAGAGFVYVLPALGAVVGAALIAVARDFLLGFEQARRASAYLFQLRIERQAKDRPATEVVIETLPDKVKQNFLDAPSTDRAVTIDRFSAVPDVVKRMTEDCANTGLLLVHGPYGVGRTTWLKHLEEQLQPQLPVKWWAPHHRMSTAAEFVQSAAALFEVELGHAGPTVPSLVDALADQPPTAVLLDGLEWLFLRGLGGYGALTALFEVASETQNRFSWAVTVPRPGLHFLSQSKRLLDHASQVIELPRWNEQEIRQLIQRRLKRCNINVSFDELLVQAGDAERPDAHLVDNEDGYLRLLWTFSDGNPRIAQYFWLRSLVRQNDQDFKVRRYTAASPDDLEVIPEGDRFILAAFVLHRALTAHEAARACNLPLAQTQAHIRRCVERGIYVPCPVSPDRWVIAVAWWEATLRFLRRKNLFMS